MGREHVLYFARIDVELAADDHVLLAIEDEQVTSLVRAGDVTGAKSAVL